MTQGGLRDNAAKKSDLNKDELYFFPYSIAIIQSYSQQIDEITQSYNFKKLIFKIDINFDNFIDTEIIDPDVVGFSNYVWNSNRHLLLMEKIKNKYPESLIVVGGPSFPNLNFIDSEEYFAENPFIDVGVYGEGEKTFANILKKHSKNESLDEVSGILFKKDNKLIKTKRSERISDLEEIPSPYLNGIFDDLSNQHPNVKFQGILETDRGCPFKCTFCDWGSLTHQKMKTFNLDRVYDEMTFLSKKEVESFHFTNSNLGIFKERDYKIIDYLCNLHEKTGYPKIVNEAGYSKTPQEKNSNLEIKKRLKKEFGDTYRPPRVSLQSLDDNILSNIKRKDFYFDDFEEILSNDFMTPIEYVFPLPGHTYQNFTTDMSELLKNKKAHVLVHPCILLPNAPMNEISYRNKFKLKVKIVKADSENSIETVPLIISTDTLTLNTNKKCWMYLWLINSFYRINRVRKYHDSKTKVSTFDVVKRIDRMANEISYKDFFILLQSYLEENAIFTSLIYSHVKEKLYDTENNSIDSVNTPHYAFDDIFVKNKKLIEEDFDRFFKESF